MKNAVLKFEEHDRSMYKSQEQLYPLDRVIRQNV